MCNFISRLALTSLLLGLVLMAAPNSGQSASLNAEAQARLSNTYIFKISDNFPATSVLSMAASSVAQVGGEFRYTFESGFKGFSATLSPSAAAALVANNPFVTGFEKVQLVTPSAPGGTKGKPSDGGGGGGGGGDASCKGGPKKCPVDNSPSQIELPIGCIPSLDLDEIDVNWGLAQIGADHAWADLNICGEGANLVIIDFGVDDDHPDLVPFGDGNGDGGLYTCDGSSCSPGISSQPSAGDGFSQAEPDPHGSFVTGIAAARANGSDMVGIAPAAKLFVYNITELSPTLNLGLATGFSDSLIAAINDLTAKATANLAAIDAFDGRTVVNLSLKVNSTQGGDCPASGSDPVLLQSICAAIDAGIVFVTSMPDISTEDGSTFAPASYDDVIVVAPSTQSDELAAFAGHEFGTGMSGIIDSAAPGQNIVSLDSTGGIDIGPWGGLLGDGYDGSSYAAPHVSGAIALCLDRLDGTITGSNATSNIQALVASALNPPTISKTFGDASSAGVIDVLALVTACSP